MLLKEFNAGKMLVRIFKTRDELGLMAAADAVSALKNVINEKGECNVIFAAAPSQNEFLNVLCKSDVDWSKVNAFHMDEYIGLGISAPQAFSNFLKNAIFEKLQFKSVNYINGNAENISEEIIRYSKMLQDNPVDIVFMGIGENGHIAFNDPHVAHFDDTVLMRVVELDEKCRRQQVNDGCFKSIEEVPKNALTLTVPALMAAKSVFCMVPATTKAEAVKQTVYGEIRETLPASILRTHSSAILYVDSDSGKHIL